VSGEVRNVIIIGSGPAGYTAGLYTARAMLEPLMFAGYMSGGQLMLTSDVENFPGYPNGIGGPEMMIHMREQAERFGLEVHDKNVEKVDFSERPFRVWVEGDEHRADAVIICTGAEAIWLGAEGEEAQKGRGISTCATCDGAFFRDEEIIVVGGGDSAMEEAIFLTRFASKVTLVHRRDVFRASKVMYERADKHPKIEIQKFRQVKKWLSDEKGLTGAVLEDPRDGSEYEIACTGAFIAIGHKPITQFLGGQVETDNEGYILANKKVATCQAKMENGEICGARGFNKTTHEKGMEKGDHEKRMKTYHQKPILTGYSAPTETSVSGVFAAGDVVDTRYRQAITAAGMGCQAAIDAEKWLEDQR